MCGRFTQAYTWAALSIVGGARNLRALQHREKKLMCSGLCSAQSLSSELGSSNCGKYLLPFRNSILFLIEFDLNPFDGPTFVLNAF